MPKAIEDCVKKIHGTNKKTGKPYTKSEKWAICTAAHKNKKGEAELELDEFSSIIDRVERVTELCLRKLVNSGKAANSEAAYSLFEVALARVGYDIDSLEFIFSKIL